MIVIVTVALCLFPNYCFRLHLQPLRFGWLVSAAAIIGPSRSLKSQIKFVLSKYVDSALFGAIFIVIIMCLPSKAIFIVAVSIFRANIEGGPLTGVACVYFVCIDINCNVYRYLYILVFMRMTSCLDC